MLSFRLKNLPQVVGAIVFLWAFIFAGQYFFERLNSDSGHYFFKAYNDGHFRIEHSRYVLGLSQILTVIASWLNFSPKIAAFLYSINHVLLFFSVWVLVLFKYKNANAAMLILLLQFLGLRESVYTPQFELYYGLALLVLWFAIIKAQLESNKRKIIPQLFASLVLFLVFTSHPFAIICFGVLMLYLFLEYKLKLGYSLLFVSIVLISYLVLKSSFTSDYESGKINQFFHALDAGMLKQFARSDLYTKGFGLLVKYYFDVLLIFVGISIYIASKKKFYLLSIYVGSFAAMVFIIWVMFYPGDVDRYLEQVYFPLALLVVFPIIKLKIISPKIYLLFIGLFVYRIIIIQNNTNKYVERTATMQRFINQARSSDAGSKFFLTEKEMGKEAYNQANWGYGFETLILSTFDGKAHVTITKDEDLNYNNNLQLLKPNEYLYSQWERIPTDKLKHNKFKLREGNYKLLADTNNNRN